MCVSFFDLQKFFDSVSPQALFDSVCENNFPMLDALMGLQMHTAPRTIVLNAIPSIPFQVHTSILAGCIYSVPWVKSLMHQGSARIANDHPMFKTYVDDTANVASGTFGQVQTAIVECDLAFNKFIIKKRGFVLSPKSAIVATSKKLANSIANELSQYGISVQVIPGLIELVSLTIVSLGLPTSRGLLVSFLSVVRTPKPRGAIKL